MTRVVLITVTPRIASTGALTTLYLAGGGKRKGYHYPDAGGTQQHWRAGVVDLPRFSSSIGFDETGWTGHTVPQVGDLVFAPYNKTVLSEVAGYYWPGAAITVRVGVEETEVFATTVTAIVDNVATDDSGRVTLTVADLSRNLDVPLLTGTFGGTGGLDGDASAESRVKRRSWGRVFDVEGRLLDGANNIYEFGDPAYPISSFVDLRDRGRSDPFTVLAAQSTPAATFAALQASSPAQGGAVVAPSIACAKWWTQPAGPLCADLKGEVGTGYVERAAQIAARILLAGSGPALTNATAINTAKPYATGIHVADENETIAAVIDRLLLGIGCTWSVDPTGTATVRPFTFSSPAASLRSLGVTRLKTFPPIGARTLGYQKNERVHSDGEIATVLTDPILQIDPGSVTLRADAAGNIIAGQLPITIDADMTVGGVDVSTSTTWSSQTTNVTISAIAADGSFTITDASQSGKVVVSGTYNGKTPSPKTVVVTVNSAAPAGNSIMTFPAVSSSSYPTSVSAGPITFTTNSAGQVTISVNLSYFGAGIALAGKLRFRHVGDPSFTDMSSEYVGTAASGGSYPTAGRLAWSDTYNFNPSTSYEFGIDLRLSSGSGSVTPSGSVGFA